MNTDYLWWLLALVIAGGSMVAFFAVGIPEIEDEPPEDPAGQGAEARHPAAAAADTAGGRLQSAPVSTTVPGSEDPSATSDTP